MHAFLRRTARAVALVARDPEVPRPLRAAAGIGLLPIPGPLDEVVLILAGAALWILYRGRLRSAWDQAAEAASPLGSPAPYVAAVSSATVATQSARKLAARTSRRP